MGKDSGGDHGDYSIAQEKPGYRKMMSDRKKLKGVAMNFINKLYLCLRHLELGYTITLPSGYTLAWSAEHEAVGFQVVQLTKDEEQTLIDQIDSEIAWYFLMQYAREMTSEEAVILAANSALTKYKKENI